MPTRKFTSELKRQWLAFLTLEGGDTLTSGMSLQFSGFFCPPPLRVPSEEAAAGTEVGGRKNRRKRGGSSHWGSSFMRKAILPVCSSRILCVSHCLEGSTGSPPLWKRLRKDFPFMVSFLKYRGGKDAGSQYWVSSRNTSGFLLNV